MDVQPSVISSDDAQLVEIIRSARTRVLLVAPGVSLPIARALCERWVQLEDPRLVQVLLDIDPEVCRIGYGEIAAIQLLQETATYLRASIHHRPGIRVGVLITDDTTLVFSPTPLLVESLSGQCPHPNAVRFETIESGPSLLKTLEQEYHDLLQGGEPLIDERVESAARDLAANPPLKFDLARTVRVFNAQFEFVDLELKGLLVERKTVPIPSDLMGLVKDLKTQQLLRTTFKLVGDDSEISGENINKLKESIVRDYLVMLPGYGAVILRENKPKFQDAVNRLVTTVEEFRKTIAKQLQADMDANRSILINALTPTVCNTPPERWLKFLGPQPSKETVMKLLDAELKKIFGSADKLLNDMDVTVMFKGVTYESLNDPKFIETAMKKIPSLANLHEEYDAACASRP